MLEENGGGTMNQSGGGGGWIQWITGYHVRGARRGGGLGGGCGGGTTACGGSSGGGRSSSPIFLEQPLEREFTPFFLQMTAKVCGGVPSLLIEPIVGREMKGPT